MPGTQAAQKSAKEHMFLPWSDVRGLDLEARSAHAMTSFTSVGGFHHGFEGGTPLWMNLCIWGAGLTWSNQKMRNLSIQSPHMSHPCPPSPVTSSFYILGSSNFL